jgi:Leucine-rich repeat (LRR) protein
MYGSVPWNLILQLYNLEMLQICCTQHTGLNGSLPQDIGRLSKLQIFSIGENDIKDVHLPLSIGKLTKLWFLDLEYVSLRSGELWYFNNMTQLKYLHLTNCGLKGTLPKDFGQTHPNIIDLRLYGNKLEGELHSCFLGFKKITQLSLGSNLYLHGLFPSALSKLETLQVLDLSGNNFTGFAKNMTFNKQLQTLYIDRNVNLKVEGNLLLQALQPCKDQLRMLVARNCGLKGDLSKTLWNFDNIMYIDLSQNNLTGHIPKNDAQFSMPYLFYLALASNNLSGDLSKGFFAPLRTLTYLDLRGNRYMKTKAPLPHEFLNATLTETLHKDTFTCPTLRLTGSGGRADVDPDYYGYRLCFCNRGYYGFMKYCKPCMKGASCDVEASPTQEGRFKEVIEVKMTIDKGYWPCCGNFTNVTRIVKCSYQQEKFDDEICSPSGKCKCQLNQLNGHLQTSCDTSCICRHGNKGRFCSQCKDGYYKKGSLCISCPEFRKNFPVVLIVCFLLCLLGSIALLVCLRYAKKLVLILIFTLAVTLIVLHYKNIIPGWFFVIIFTVWILGLFGGIRENLKSFLSIALFFFQSLDAMLSDANIWPRTIVLLKYQITNAFNFAIPELTCSFSYANRPEVSFAVILLLPATGIFLIWLLHGLSKITSSCRQSLIIPSSSCKRLSIKILLFMYFPITAKTLQAVLPCEHRDGLSYLKVTPWLDCNGTSYNWLVALGYVSLVVFVIGVPFFVFVPLLCKYVDHHGQAVSEETNIWLKPLYKDFKTPYRRYFPLVFLGRRLLLAVFLTVVPTTSSFQVIGITLLLVIFIAITLIFRPFEQYSERFEFETLADVIVSVVLLLSFVGLALLRVSPKFDNSLVWLIISMNCVVVLSCVVGMLVLFAVNLCKSPGNVQPENVQQYEQIPD